MNAFVGLAGLIDEARVRTPADFLEPKRFEDSREKRRIRSMLLSYDASGNLTRSNPLEISARVIAPKVSVLKATAMVINAHVIERERLRLQYERPSSTWTIEGDGGLVARVMHARFSCQELVLRGCRPNGKLSRILRVAQSGLKYAFYLRCCRVHNVNFKDDPPVRGCVDTVAVIRIIPHANSGAVLLAALLMAAGRSMPLQDWMRRSSAFHRWLCKASWNRRSLDSLRYILVGECAPGDGATTETLLGSSDYAYAMLTAAMYELIQQNSPDEFLTAADSYGIFIALRKAKGYGSFRAHHIAVWVAAAYNKPIVIPPGCEEDILGPNPRLLVRWARNHFSYPDLLEECVRQAQRRRPAFVETMPDGQRRHVPLAVLITGVVLQFTICKVVQALRLLTELRLKGLRWRTEKLDFTSCAKVEDPNAIVVAAIAYAAVVLVCAYASYPIMSYNII